MNIHLLVSILQSLASIALLVDNEVENAMIVGEAIKQKGWCLP